MYEDVIGVLERLVDDTGKVCLSKEEIEAIVNEALEVHYEQGSSRVVSGREMNGTPKNLDMIDEANFHVAGIVKSLENIRNAMNNIWDLADSLLKEYSNCEGVLANADSDFFYKVLSEIQEQAEG